MNEQFFVVLTGGRKRRFGLSGLVNVLFTNLLLQLLLAINIKVGVATLMSQVFNGMAGFFLYGSFVFQSSNSRSIGATVRYCGMMGFVWVCNWAGIILVSYTGVKSSIAALMMIPVLALMSYLIQKHWVFAGKP